MTSVPGATSWGWRDGHRVWRLRDPEGHPGMHADHTGPDTALDAAIKASRVFDRLNWEPDGPAAPVEVWEWGVRFDGEDVLPLSEGSARRQAGAAGDGQPRLVRRRVGEWEAAP